MQCDKTISHMVTAGRSYFCTRQNVCVTADKTNMAAGKINYGYFEMLSWPNHMSNHIINICFWLLETSTKCSYFVEENMRPGAQQLAFEVKFEYIVHRSTNTSWAGGLWLNKFQTTGIWSVKHKWADDNTDQNFCTTDETVYFPKFAALIRVRHQLAILLKLLLTIVLTAGYSLILNLIHIL